jgi:flagellar M-ring protein FliF
MTQRLVATLEPIIGADRVKASVNVEYDPSTMDENQEQYDPNVSVALTMQRSEEQVGSGSLGGVPGTSSNVPGAKNAAGKKQATAADPYDSTNQVSKSESATYGVNRVVRHKMSPAGRVKRISAAVLIDDADVTTQQNGKTVTMRQKRTPDELKQIEQLAKTAIGLDETRGDAITVQNLSFVRPPAEEFPTPSRIDKIRTRLSDYSNYIRYAALLLLFAIAYLLMIRPIKKQALAALRQQAPAQVEGAPAAQPLPGANLEAAPALPDHSQETATLKERLREKIKSEPAVSSRVIQAWLHEEEA